MSRNTALPVAVAAALLLGAGVHPTSAQASEAGIERPSPQTQAQSSVRAPETVDPGQAVSVSVVDGKIGGRLELWAVAARSGKSEHLSSVAVEGSEVRLTAPGKPGSYQLRYVSANGQLRASQALEVAALPILLSVPEQMRAGREAEVRWRGPASPGDVLRIVASDTGAVLTEVPASGRAGPENVAVLRAPADVGEYALEYRSGEHGATLRTLPISVIRG